jgi:hypothetical protein
MPDLTFARVRLMFLLPPADEPIPEGTGRSPLLLPPLFIIPISRFLRVSTDNPASFSTRMICALDIYRTIAPSPAPALPNN